MSNVGAKWHARKAADIADEPGKVHFENSWIKITYKGLNPIHFGIKITLDKVVRVRLKQQGTANDNAVIRRIC